jgi:hypothetical protein
MKHWILRVSHSCIARRIFALIGAFVGIMPAYVAAAPPTQYMYCWAHVQQAKTRYLTDIFATTGNAADVNSAWQQYLEQQHIDAGQQKKCDAGVSLASVKAMRDLHYSMVDAIGAHIAASDWKYVAGQVPESDPGTLYLYCQSGTSVAGVTYVSDVFGIAMPKMVVNAPDFAAPFFQYVQGKYADTPGLGAGKPSGPGDRWCEPSGNISEAERSKKTWEDTLRAQSRQIVETGWRYDATSQPESATGSVAGLQASAVAAGAGTARPATVTSKPGALYGFCTARTADEKTVFVSAVFEMPMADVAAGSRVITAEFNKALVQKYGSPAGPNEARSAGCAPNWNLSAAAVEEKRQIIFADARQHRTQLIDTGWTFVRTAQTPPPGPPVGH